MVIAKFLIGSRAFGYARPGSDTDYYEIFLPTLGQLAGFDRIVKTQTIADGVDTIHKPFHEFVELLVKGNAQAHVIANLCPEDCTHEWAKFLTRYQRLAPPRKAIAASCLGHSEALKLRGRHDAARALRTSVASLLLTGCVIKNWAASEDVIKTILETAEAHAFPLHDSFGYYSAALDVIRESAPA